ncbi:MAG: AAA family ATPase, partial [Dermabacter sp.]|nr:AAA family ATPase [Dermabacter sp.]
PQIIADTWMEHPDAGVFLHVGRSGGIVLDVDTPINLPDILTEALTETPAPFQYTRRNDLARRHYVYTQPTGRRFGNGLGNLPAGWGDIRGVNGVIIVAPSEHPDPEGHYAWGRVGEVPELPATIAEALTDTTDTADVASDATIRTFITEHTSGNNHAQVDAWVATFNRYVREGDSRHQRATSILTGALKEAAAGYYPAAHAEQQLREAFLTAVTSDGVSEKQGKARTPHAALNEWRGILAWAIAQARAADPQKARERAELHAPTINLDQYATGPSGRVNTTTGEILDQQPETPTSATPKPAKEADSSSLDALLNPEDASLDKPSWSPVDTTPYLDGTYTRPEPQLLKRSDGPALLYPGKTHTIYGESESGKSWIAQYVAVETLTNSGRVLYVDFESDAGDILDRLQTLGATPAQLKQPHFTYVRPDASPDAFHEQEAFRALLTEAYDFIVFDGVTEALNLHGKATKDNDEITQWMRAVPRRFSRETGAAVVLVDHVVKSIETRGRFPIGGQAKMAAIDGAAFLVEPVSAIGPGLDGALTIRVTKDRPGA